MTERSHAFFATTARGLEEVLEQELVDMGMKGVQKGQGGVAFEGPVEECYRANLHLRTSNRILMLLKNFPCDDPDTLYRESVDVPWEELLTPSHTFMVDAFTRDTDRLRNSQYSALKVKDAVADAMRRRRGARPNVDRMDPDLRINLYVNEGKASLSLDSSGDRLHRRGYRQDRGMAPLKETLAAGLILLSQWDRRSPLLDPMCGSGTILIEAALMAEKRAPGSLRSRFGFQRWLNFKRKAWKAVLSGASEAQPPEAGCRILGMDTDASVLRAARMNARKAGVDHLIRFVQQDALSISPPETHGIILTNPPFGHRLRLGRDAGQFYKTFGDMLKRSFSGWVAEVFTGDKNMPKQIGLRTCRRRILFNGPIECRLLRYELY